MLTTELLIKAKGKEFERNCSFIILINPSKEVKASLTEPKDQDKTSKQTKGKLPKREIRGEHEFACF